MIPGLTPYLARKDKRVLFIISMLSPLISFLLSIMVFPSTPYLPFVFFTSMMISSYIFEMLRMEESDILAFMKLYDFSLLKQDVYELVDDTSIVISGLVVGILLIFLFLPSNMRKEFFGEPIGIISRFVGFFSSSDEVFYKIFLNNLEVLFLSFLMSFLIQQGFSFVIVWNSSLLSVLLGELIIREKKFNVIFGYLLHAFPEFISYMIAAISGSILSLAFMRKHPKSILIQYFKLSLSFFILSIIILLISAGIETTISPIIMNLK